MQLIPKFPQRIIAFIAHPDDESHCGALLKSNSLLGGKNLVICFTGNDQRKTELKKSSQILDFEFEVLEFPELEIKNSCGLRDKYRNWFLNFQPDIVVIQKNDYHPDHQMVYNISVANSEFAMHGCKKTAFVPKLFLELETFVLLPSPDIIIDSDDVFDFKLNALMVHSSQVEGKAFGTYYKDMLYHRSRLRGCQLGCEHGEAYKVISLPILGCVYPRD